MCGIRPVVGSRGFARAKYEVVPGTPIQCLVPLHGERCSRPAHCFSGPGRTTAGLWFRHYDCGLHRFHVSVPSGLWWDDCDCSGEREAIAVDSGPG